MMTIDEQGAAPLPKAERGCDAQAVIIDPPGDVIGGRYRVIKEVGRGGMGIVYQALDTKLNRMVAVKRLIPNAANLSRDQRRFAREAQTIASLGHMHIVSIHDIGQDGIGHFITMEYVQGPNLAEESEPSGDPVTLSRYVKKRNPLPVEEACELTVQLCSALGYAHRQGIVHRDIKPGNVLLTPKMDPKLVDFGLARPLHGESRDDITLQGQFIGTPEYVAPEQWTSNEIDERADIFSLGAVMWYALSGRVPRHFDPQKLPPDVQPVLSKALAQRPKERFQTMVEFGDALRARGPKGKVLTNTVTDDDLRSTIPGSRAWTCPNCERNNPDEAKFCVHCGTRGTSACPICETEVKVSSQFCPSCGCDMNVAKDYLGSMEEAKRQAGFMEFEAALQTLRGVSGVNNTEAAALVKEWRQVILLRRNLLNEFDSAIRVYNINGAVKLQEKLAATVPEECLSDSPDFETAARYNALMSQLDKLLREAVDRASKGYNMQQYSQMIKNLNLVYGKERCLTINEELWAVQNDLNHTVTQAGLAIGMNCISFAFELLNASNPWHSDELGDRRSRLLKNCRALLEERARAIEAIEEALREEKYTEVLRRLKAMSRFRLPPRNSEMRPAREDIAAHDRIVDIDKILTTKILEIVPEWIEEDEWEYVNVAMEALRAGAHSTWRRCEDQVRSLVNREIAKRYNRAIDIERRGKITHAQRAWDYFREIPKDMVTGNLWQYARDFKRRRRVALLSKRKQVIIRTIFMACALWAVPIFGLVQYSGTLMANPAKRLPEIAFGLVNGILFLFVIYMIGRRKVVLREQTADVDAPSVRLGILGAILALSPLGCGLVFALSKLIVLDLPILMLLALPVWIMADIIRGRLLRLPGGPGLSMIWIGLAVAAFAVPQLRELQGKPWVLWPLLAMLHCFLFGMLSIVDQIMSRKVEDDDKDEEELDAVESASADPRANT